MLDSLPEGNTISAPSNFFWIVSCQKMSESVLFHLSELRVSWVDVEEMAFSLGTECHPIFGQNWAALLRWPFWTDLKVYFRVGLQIKSLNSRFQQASRFSPVSSSSWVSQMDLHLLCHQLGSTWNINEHHGRILYGLVLINMAYTITYIIFIYICIYIYISIYCISI